MTDTLRVLYIHPFAAQGGATKSLVEMIAAFPSGSVDGTVIAPPGAAAKALAKVGLAVIQVRGVSQWDNTRFGHYRGFRWLILLRELASWPATIKGLRQASKQGSYDLIHCNEITAMLVGALAKKTFRVPLIVHVRSLQRSHSSGLLSGLLHRFLWRHADAVVAIDEAVRRTLPVGQSVSIIHNCIIAPAELAARSETDRFCVAIIGVLHRSKGLYELLEAMRILRDRGVDVHLLVVGENVHDLSGVRGWLLRKFDFARDVRSDLEAYVIKHSLQNYVEFTGFVSDIQSIYARTDAVCFPSHLDAPGRPVFEAALFGCPAIVAMRDPTSDVLVHDRTGICIQEPAPFVIAEAIEKMARNRDATRTMGVRAREMALGRFESHVCARKMLQLYLLTRKRDGAEKVIPDNDQTSISS